MSDYRVGQWVHPGHRRAEFLGSCVQVIGGYLVGVPGAYALVIRPFDGCRIDGERLSALPGVWVLGVRFGWPALGSNSVHPDFRLYGVLAWGIGNGDDLGAVRPATPEELARYQLDQLGAEDAL